MAAANLKACCVSLSGGVDSACTLGLMKYASKMDNSPIKKVLAISQPIHSSQWAFDRAHECAKAMDAEIVTIDQNEIYDALKKLVDTQLEIAGGQFASGQLRSYMRTPSSYYVAQLLSQSGFPCIVMGTGNKDEDHYLAYFCKAGDGVVDVQLIAGIHKSEVFLAARELGSPVSILDAKPSADLWDGQSDEDELGFSYDFIELWINYVEMDENGQNEFKTGLSADALQQLDDWGAKAVAVHNRNKHKLNSPFNIYGKLN
jgi:NAD+ synthase (glutamine-hydrolysing)